MSWFLVIPPRLLLLPPNTTTTTTTGAAAAVASAMTTAHPFDRRRDSSLKARERLQLVTRAGAVKRAGQRAVKRCEATTRPNSAVKPPLAPTRGHGRWHELLLEGETRPFPGGSVADMMHACLA